MTTNKTDWAVEARDRSDRLNDLVVGARPQDPPGTRFHRTATPVLRTPPTEALTRAEYHEWSDQ